MIVRERVLASLALAEIYVASRKRGRDAPIV
jgi:hypothetical protein